MRVGKVFTRLLAVYRVRREPCVGCSGQYIDYDDNDACNCYRRHPVRRRTRYHQYVCSLMRYCNITHGRTEFLRHIRKQEAKLSLG